MKERPMLFSGSMVRAILEGRKTQTRRIVKQQPEYHHWGFLPGYEFRQRVIPNVYSPNGANTCAWRTSHAIPRGSGYDEDRVQWAICPYGKEGDRLWVRETFGFVGGDYDENEEIVAWEPDRPAKAIHELKFGRGYMSGHAIYAADGPFEWNAGDDACMETCSMRKPSIHMPRCLSRITLEVESVRVERLQEISEADALAEGVAIDRGYCYHVAGHEGKWAHATAKGCMETLWGSINGTESWDANPFVWVIKFKETK